jgi:tyrosinase
VHFFLGEFNNDPFMRAFDNNLVGTFSVFANDPETTGCGKCQGDAQDGLIVTASIPLTGALLDRISDLQTLGSDIVIPYLQKQLHWRCNRVCTLHMSDWPTALTTLIRRTQPDGTPISRSDIPSLKVGVASVTVEVPTEDELLPRYLEWRPLYEVTSGRTCGIVLGDDL